MSHAPCPLRLPRLPRLPRLSRLSRLCPRPRPSPRRCLRRRPS